MNMSFRSLTLALGLIVAATAFAQAPAGAPAGSTGLCKDGSYTSADSKKGACAGHKGVKDWYLAAAPAAAAAATVATAPAAATDSTATNTTAATAPMKPAPAATARAAAKAAAAPTTAPAAGGGPGQVWVNTTSKVYHCQGTQYYGKTKQGEYMTEAAAKVAGAHADHGKACTS